MIIKKELLFLHALVLVSYCSFSQGVGIGTTAPDSSAALDITATSRGIAGQKNINEDLLKRIEKLEISFNRNK